MALGAHELGWKPTSWAGSSVFADPAGRWVVGISLLTCVPGWWTMLSSGRANLRPLERDSFLICVPGSHQGRPPGKSGAGDGGSSATLTGLWHMSGCHGGQPGTAQGLLHQCGVCMDAKTSDLWNRKQPECRGRWKWDSWPRGWDWTGKLCLTRVELLVAFQAGQTPAKWLH